MNVTQEIQRNHIVYGASDNSAPQGLAAGKCLNYAKGATIAKPENTDISVIPHTLHYEDSVGLFGSENYFLKVNINIVPGLASKACFEESGWECANIDHIDYNEGDYTQSAIDFGEFPTVNTYVQGYISGNTLPKIKDAYISVDLQNLKTNNIYQDDWLDVRLYTEERKEHPYEKMYIRPKSFFYIGVHARNTKRLPYNIACVVGHEFRTYESIEDKRYIMRSVN